MASRGDSPCSSLPPGALYFPLWTSPSFLPRNIKRYADQKAGLLPDWAAKNVDEIANPLKYNAMQAGKMALRAGLPAAAIYGASSEPDLSSAIMNTLIPGGASDAGESRDEEAMMLGEAQGAANYKKAKARRDALKLLMEKK